MAPRLLKGTAGTMFEAARALRWAQRPGGAGTSGAPHAMAVNETVVAFVRGGTAPDSAGGVGLVTSWATEVEFALPGGKRKVRPDGVWQAPEIGVPVLMVEVDRSTMAPARVAAKFAAYRELFRNKIRDSDPVLADEEPADRMVHWWRRAYPGHTREGYPPVALVVTDAGPTALANPQEAVADLSVQAWGGQWRSVVRDYNDDGWREHDDAVPVIATTLELLAEHGPLGPVWWRYGRAGRYSLTEALDNPNNRAAYDQRQATREKEAQAHRELMKSLACTDCGNVPKEESSHVYELGRSWTRRPGGRCHPCHKSLKERQKKEAKAAAENSRTPAPSTPGCARAGRAGARSAGRRVRCWSCGRRPARTGWSAPGA